MSDLIGYAVAWKSKTGGLYLGVSAGSREEAEVALSRANSEWPMLDNFLIEIYPDSRAEMREEVMQ